MQITVQQGNIIEADVDAIIVNLFEGVKSPGGATGAVDRHLGGLITKLIADDEFKGSLNETAVLHVASGAPFRKVIVVGLGKQEEFTLERVRQAAAASVKAAAKGKVSRIGTIVHGAGIGGLSPDEAAQSLAEGVLLGSYRYETYKTEAESRDPVTLVVCEMDAAKVAPMQAAVDRGRLLAEATNYARDLVNAPGNELTPAALAERARAMAEAEGLECTVLGRDDMERLGMGALLGVAQGSAQEPQLVVLRYAGSRKSGGAGEADDLVALVGKGVTFDTGGISIKPSAGMGAMKGDMAGAAAVLGAMQAIARIKPEQPVLAVLACVENMPSGTAQRPGDIVRTMSGKTIEIDNTDAEGRLILADAVAYAESLGAKTIIDMATLTGACIIALGRLYSAVIANDDDLARRLIEAGARAGERHWQLPADPDFKDQYKSDVADIKNTGGREAGTITGGLIIGEFVKDARWAHFDIAGTSFTAKEGPYTPKGGTGVGVRTLVEFICNG